MRIGGPLLGSVLRCFTPHRLSSRQAKELLIRGRTLRVAIPAPWDDVDPLAYARSTLTPDVSPLVASAEYETLWCRPNPGVPSLCGILGEIVHDDSPGFGWAVEAIIVTLEPLNPRANPLPVQWPGSVVDGAYRWPRAESEARNER